MKKSIIMLLFSLAVTGTFAQETNKNAKTMDEEWGTTTVSDSFLSENATWYHDAKFAMFIHWGLYSEAGGEWEGKNYYGISEWLMHQAKIPTMEYYEKLSPRFNPIHFNAEEIVQLAVDAGMKYIVFTSKHCDGFAMYHSRASKHNVVDATPFKRDPLLELARACEKQEIGLGLYYAHSKEWSEKDAYGNTWEFDPKEIDFQKYLDKKCLPQVEELLTSYGPIKLIFFDTPGEISKDAVQQIRNLVRKIQPDCLINSRIGHSMGDYITLGDNEIPDKPVEGLWESIDTHNNSWAFSKFDNNWKSDKEIISRLIRVITKGGNYMLNIGPRGDGSIPGETIYFLRKTGEWIKKNSEAIYGTKPIDLGIQTGMGATSIPGKTFLFIMEWPKDGRLWIPRTTTEIKKAYLLSEKKKYKVNKSGDDIFLTVPTMAPDPRANVIVLEHEGNIEFLKDQILWPTTITEFLPENADTNRVRKGNSRWMEIFGDWHHVSTLDSWENNSSYARWDFYAPEKGKYYVDIDYACNLSADMKEGLVNIDEDAYHFVPVFTGDITDLTGVAGRIIPRFSTRRIGLLNVKSAGRHTLKIQLNDDEANGWIRLSKVRFTPVG